MSFFDHHAGLDFETSGSLPEFSLQPWRIAQGKAWATSFVGMIPPRGKAVLPQLFTDKLPTINARVMKAFLEECIDDDRRIVGWNTVFDIQLLIAYGLEDLVLQCKWLDGMLLWKHATITPEYDLDRGDKRSFGLKEYVREFHPDDAGYEDEVDYHSTDPDEIEKLHQYNIKDVYYTLRGAERWWTQLTSGQQTAALIEADCLPMVARANISGMLVDTLSANNLRQWLIDTAQAKLDTLAPLGITEEITRSPKRLREVIFGPWGLTPIKLTATGEPSTDKETLHELAVYDPRVKVLHQYRNALLDRKKFAESPLEAAVYNEDGYARPQASVFSAYTGRMTYSSKQGKNKDTRRIGFALHQEKRDPRYREKIVPPPGYTLVEADAAGQEFRWMAECSGDDVMRSLCLPGEDPHSYMGSRIDPRWDYRELIEASKVKASPADNLRKSGKVGNLCASHSSPILTDRGHVAIQDVRRDDLVWDGIEFVAHDGVAFSGVREVMTYAGLTMTPEHRVLVDGQWVEFQEAARHGWRIQSARGSAFRIVDGIIRRSRKTAWREVREMRLRLWDGIACCLAKSIVGEISGLQELRHPSPARTDGAPHQPRACRSNATTTCSELVFSVLEPERWLMAQLRCAWDRVSVSVSQGWCGVRQETSTSSYLRKVRHRSQKQRRSLRTGQPSVGHTQGEPTAQAWLEHGYVEGGIDTDAELGRKSLLADLYDALCGTRAFWRSYPPPRPAGREGEAQGLAQNRSQAPVYDVVNCGPRNQYSANGLIVHNSLQYRTSISRFCSTARVDYDVDMTMEEAERIHRVYPLTYRGVPRYWINQISIVKACGYVETLAGRRVEVTGDWSRQSRMAWSMGSTAINYRIQGTGADQKYLALSAIKDLLPKYKAYFAFDMHDGLYFYVPNAVVDQFCAEIKRILDDLPYLKVWGYQPSIPMPWDVKVGYSWGSLKEWKEAA